jgi:hypothetical protein
MAVEAILTDTTYDETVDTRETAEMLLAWNADRLAQGAPWQSCEREISLAQEYLARSLT